MSEAEAGMGAGITVWPVAEKCAWAWRHESPSLDPTVYRQHRCGLPKGHASPRHACRYCGHCEEVTSR